MFLDSSSKSLWKYLYCTTTFQWRGDSSDVEALKMMEKKLANSLITVNQMDEFVNNKVYNSVPE